MLFLWTITKRGKIWLDGDGFRQIITSRLPRDITCQEVSFSGDQNLLNIYLVLPDTDDDPQKRLSLIDKFDDLFRPSGIAVHVHWTQKSNQDAAVSGSVWRSPLTYGIAAAILTAAAQLGISRILNVTIAAIAGYILAWFALSEDGRNQIARLTKEFRR